METVGPAVDPELHLLTQWGDADSVARTRKAAIVSVALHVAVIIVISLLPPDFLGPAPRQIRPPVKRTVTPLIDPPTEFTQQRQDAVAGGASW